MTRATLEKISITGKLKAYSPLHVGAAIDDLSIDMPVAVNGKGEVYIPGTSLAGAMRDWWCENFGDDETNTLWGFQKGDRGHASFITVPDAVIENYNGLELRDGVGIDRITGAAAHKFKFDREVVPCGGLFDFKLFVDVPSNDTGNLKPKLLAMLDALAKGEIRFGAAKTRGLGKMKLIEAKVSRRDYSSLQNLIETIAAESDAPEVVLGSAKQITTKSVASFRIHWTATTSLLSALATEDGVVKFVPFTSSNIDNPDEVVAIIPGASIKGAMRAMAERIIRTLQGVNAPEAFLDQIDGLPLIDELFGRRKGKESCRHHGQAAVMIDDCRISDPIKRETYQELVSLTSNDDKQKLPDARAHVQSTAWKNALPYQHVAIDRWTGGASEGALYSMLQPDVSGGKCIEITIDLRRAKTDHNALLGFMLLILREMMEQRIPLGFGVNRGLGSFKIDQIDFTPPAKTEPVKITSFLAGERPPELTPFIEAWCAQAKIIRDTPKDEAA